MHIKLVLALSKLTRYALYQIVANIDAYSCISFDKSICTVCIAILKADY